MFSSTLYPFNFANRNGIPMIEANAVTVNTDNVVFTLPSRAFRWLSDRGVILLRITQAIPTGTTGTLPVLFSANNLTQPLTNAGGTAITAAQLPSTGVYLVYYDKQSNLMQLMTAQVPAAA